MTAPFMGLTDLKEPFDLFVLERQGVGLGALTQNLGNTKHPGDYFSKTLSIVTQDGQHV